MVVEYFCFLFLDPLRILLSFNATVSINSLPYGFWMHNWLFYQNSLGFANRVTFNIEQSDITFKDALCFFDQHANVCYVDL